jgi:hypothetical protein
MTKRKQSFKSSPFDEVTKLKIKAKSLAPKGKTKARFYHTAQGYDTSGHVRWIVFRDDFKQGPIGVKQMDKFIDTMDAYATRMNIDIGAPQIKYHKNTKMVKSKYPL